MRRKNQGAYAALLMMLFVALPVVAGGTTETEQPAQPIVPFDEALADLEGAETAVFAGGCFWGVEGVFESLIGVVDVRSGYSGGDEESAEYYTVARGLTDHAESVEIVFDPSQIDYGTLLEIFFKVAHDPTQLNYQGPDHGPQYRSAIFFANEAQQEAAEQYIRKLDRARLFDDPIVTEVVPLDEFYDAEEYHQDFIVKNPTYPYVVYWDLPKLEHLQKDYPELVKPE